jgi:uncharacterized membrane protein YbhN (UPF0104 family)
MLVATSISTVLGFLLLIPAGLGVREIVVLNLLAPAMLVWSELRQSLRKS